MITNTHPANLGRVGAAIGVTPHATQPPSRGVTGANGAASEAREAANVPWKRAYADVFVSSIMEEPYHVRLVFDYMIRRADTNGFCSGTDTALSRLFNVTLEHFLEAIKILEAPDSKSRSPENEGKRIRKVQGGWLILNHTKYQPGLTGKKVKDNEKERDIGDRYRDRDRDSATLRDRVTYEKALNPPLSTPSQQALNSWHPSELATFISLGDAEQKAFKLARYFAELAAREGKSSFPFALSCLAKNLGCSNQRASKVRASLLQKGIIKEAQPYSKEENLSAYYRWPLPTTLSIPPMPNPAPDLDDDDECPF